MTTEPRRVVLDTNVLVSLYVFADSRIAPLRWEIEAGRWLALSSEACLDEWRRVLAYPVFALSDSARAVAYTAYAQRARLIAPPDKIAYPLPRCKDRDDQKFLEVARDGQAEALITADKALLILARREKMAGRFRIMAPDVALDEVLTAPARATECGRALARGDIQ